MLRSSVSRSISRSSVFICRSQQRVVDWWKFKPLWGVYLWIGVLSDVDWPLIFLVLLLSLFSRTLTPSQWMLWHDFVWADTSQHLSLMKRPLGMGNNVLGECSWGFKLPFIELYLHVWIYIYLTHTYFKSSSVTLSASPPTYRVVMVLSSGGSSLGIVDARRISLSATGSLTP